MPVGWWYRLRHNRVIVRAWTSSQEEQPMCKKVWSTEFQSRLALRYLNLQLALAMVELTVQSDAAAPEPQSISVPIRISSPGTQSEVFEDGQPLLPDQQRISTGFQSCFAQCLGHGRAKYVPCFVHSLGSGPAMCSLDLPCRAMNQTCSQV